MDASVGLTTPATVARDAIRQSRGGHRRSLSRAGAPKTMECVMLRNETLKDLGPFVPRIREASQLERAIAKRFPAVRT